MTHRNAPLSLLTWLCRWSLVTASAGAAVSSKLPIAVSMVAIWRMLPAALASAVRGIEDLAPGRLTVTRGPWHEPVARHAGAHADGVALKLRSVC